KFVLHGEKLTGGWSLVRMKDRDDSGEGRNWLLIKRADDSARPGDADAVTAEHTRSVLSGRTLDEIAADADNVWTSNGRASGTTEGPGSSEGGAPASSERATFA